MNKDVDIAFKKHGEYVYNWETDISNWNDAEMLVDVIGEGDILWDGKTEVVCECWDCETNAIIDTKSFIPDKI